MASTNRPPDLAALLREARSSQGRGRGRGTNTATEDPSSSTTPPVTLHSKDRVIQQTDQDASVSRMSAVSLGYLEDPFAALFISDTQARRFPIINRGTYVRTCAIDRLVHSFLLDPSSSSKQIVSLGAGSDTRFFRLRSTYPSLDLIYHELDFPSITSQKISSIQQSPHLQSLLSSPSITPTTLHSTSYNIHALDLRTLGPSTQLPNLNPQIPTLLISECCLIYLPPSTADSILDVFTGTTTSSSSSSSSSSATLIHPSTPLGLILYEPINPLDAFGQVMVSNLLARGIVLQTLKKYASLTRQRERLKVRGFSGGQQAADVDFLWEVWVGGGEKERVKRLEMLDELEEWRLLARHYCVAWGWRGTGLIEREGEGGEIRDGDFGGWRLLESQSVEEL